MGNCLTSGDAANPLEGRARHYLADAQPQEQTAVGADIESRLPVPLPDGGVSPVEDDSSNEQKAEYHPLPVTVPPRRRLRINSASSSLSGLDFGGRPLQPQRQAAIQAERPALNLPTGRSDKASITTPPQLSVISHVREEWIAIQEEFDDDPDEILEQFQRNVYVCPHSASGLSSPKGSVVRPQLPSNSILGEAPIRLSPTDGLTQTDGSGMPGSDAGSYMSSWLDDQLHVRMRKESPPASIAAESFPAAKLAPGSYHVASIRCLSAAGLGEASQSQLSLKSPRPQPRKSPRRSNDSGSSGSSAEHIRLQCAEVGNGSLTSRRTWDIAAAAAQLDCQPQA